MAGEFSGKVVVVTGAGTGIGAATARAFAQQGASVVVADISAGTGEATVATIREAGGDARFAPCDVSDPRQVEGLFRGTTASYGRLDVAFNNAGILGETQRALADLAVDAWQRVIDVNLTGVFLCMKYELEQMEKQGGGAIVNNASIVGLVGFPGACAYVTAKHGLLGLTRTAALEYASKGVRVNAVCPGFIDTPMLEQAGFSTDPPLRTTIESLHAMNRLGQPEEVAQVVLFLASSRASFVTGHPLLVDGGYVAR